jgi:hypothetical protein
MEFIQLKYLVNEALHSYEKEYDCKLKFLEKGVACEISLIIQTRRVKSRLLSSSGELQV